MSFQLIFFLLVFSAVALLLQGLFISVYSPQRTSAKQIKKHLNSLAKSGQNIEKDLLLNRQIDKLSPLQNWLESQPWIFHYTYKMELAGSKLFGHQYLLIAFISSSVIALATWYFTNDGLFALAAFGITILAFQIKLSKDIDNRMIKIEEQFPEAMDVLRRGLQAGYSFTEAIKLIYEEMDGNLADEFKIMFNRINFGDDLKTALLEFVKRVPTTSAQAFCSSVSIHKETGGNLAENIDNLSKIIRQRFSFKRRVRTLSAEGRLSGWVLVLMPFVLFAVLYLTSPSYIKTLIETAEGLNMLKGGFLGMLLGIVWINRLIKIEV